MNNESIVKQFPVIEKEGLHYLDSAATCQKPNCVIDAMTNFYKEEYATVHRGIYDLSQKSTIKYNNVRRQIKDFIGAKSEKEVIFTRGATEAINLVANGFAAFISEGDEIVVTETEHHANLLPWQKIAKQKKAKLIVIPILDSGDLILDNIDKIINQNTKIIAIQHVSNVLGTIHPIETIIKKAHSIGAKVLIDACQSVSHIPINVMSLDCDFLCFSGHKCYGPTGIGVLYGKEELLNKMEPYQLGGDMIRTVTFEESTFAELPMKFEAGTPPIVEVIGLGEAINFIKKIGLEKISSIEKELLEYALKEFKKIKTLKVIGDTKNKTGVISFTLENAHPHDIGTLCDSFGVAIRAGHHCSQTTMQHYNVAATARASFACYNTKKDIDKLVEALLYIEEMFE